jgi:hypothetical protein
MIKVDSMFKLHIHTGPGHHENILIGELRKRNINFSYSKRHPELEMTEIENGVEKSIVYKNKKLDIMTYLLWGIRNKIGYLKKRNIHLDLIYDVYDRIIAKNLDKVDFLICWPQVSLHSIKKIKKNQGIVIIDYPILLITPFLI